jgi:hypothetical protein
MVEIFAHKTASPITIRFTHSSNDIVLGAGSNSPREFIETAWQILESEFASPASGTDEDKTISLADHFGYRTNYAHYHIGYGSSEPSPVTTFEYETEKAEVAAKQEPGSVSHRLYLK